MSTQESLISENATLRARLALAERWMRREVESSIAHIQRSRLKKSTRSHFANVFEEEGIEIITRKVMDEFGESLQYAPKHTLERLIDAEIYWHTLQNYPTLDALPIVLSYQKILDAWIEEKLIAPFRKSTKNIPLTATSAIDRDIENIITKKYTLSIGRLYQIISMIRSGEASGFVRELSTFWEKEVPNLSQVIISDEFFLPFSELVESEVFSKKRHESKITFRDAKNTREYCKNIFQYIFLESH